MTTPKGQKPRTEAEVRDLDEFIEWLTAPEDRRGLWYVETRVGRDNFRGEVVRFIFDRPAPDGHRAYVNRPAEDVIRDLVARLRENPK